jgi:hypothetical protein
MYKKQRNSESIEEPDRFELTKCRHKRVNATIVSRLKLSESSHKWITLNLLRSLKNINVVARTENWKYIEANSSRVCHLAEKVTLIPVNWDREEQPQPTSTKVCACQKSTARPLILKWFGWRRLINLLARLLYNKLPQNVRSRLLAKSWYTEAERSAKDAEGCDALLENSYAPSRGSRFTLYVGQGVGKWMTLIKEFAASNEEILKICKFIGI